MDKPSRNTERTDPTVMAFWVTSKLSACQEGVIPQKPRGSGSVLKSVPPLKYPENFTIF